MLQACTKYLSEMLRVDNEGLRKVRVDDEATW